MLKIALFLVNKKDFTFQIIRDFSDIFFDVLRLVLTTDPRSIHTRKPEGSLSLQRCLFNLKTFADDGRSRL